MQETRVREALAVQPTVEVAALILIALCCVRWREVEWLTFSKDVSVAAAQTTSSGSEDEEAVLSIERLVLLVVGVVVLGSTLLAVYHSPAWLWLTGAMGAHLVQASFTGLCPVVAFLKSMGVPSKAGFT